MKLENAVFEWLDIISKGTNKKVVSQLLNPYGIMWTFMVSKKAAKNLFYSWKNKQNEKQSS